MKAKIKFRKMFENMPDKAKKELVYRYYNNPLSLSVVALEIKMNTEIGKEILKDLEYEDD